MTSKSNYIPPYWTLDHKVAVGVLGTGAVLGLLGCLYGCGRDNAIPRSVQVKDFTGDGLADVLVTSANGSKKLFVGVNDGFSYIPFEDDLKNRAQ